MRGHEEWMRLACQLAQATVGQTSPNPAVGAVLVKDGALIGCGAHLKAGTPHAEVQALQMAGSNSEGATLYVTLEPCDHFGKTPPCTRAITQSGVTRVYVGSLDPDTRVSGRGIVHLKNAGIDVIEGILQEECLLVNEAYFHHRRTGIPFVTLKTATTLDGKIATSTGDSKWITGEASRVYVHELRRQHDAILVGVGTVICDNPSLTTRLDTGGNHPIRIVIDSHLRLPFEATLIQDQVVPTWIFTTDQRDMNKERQLLAMGIQIFSTGDGPRVNLDKVLTILGERNILSLLVEGGGIINASLLSGNYIQKVISFIAPKLLGGRESRTSFEGENPTLISQAKNLHNVILKKFGEDICIIGYL